MISNENLRNCGTVIHFTATRYLSPIDWDFKLNNLFTSTKRVKLFRKLRFLCIFYYANMVGRTVFRKIQGPPGDFYFIWLITVLFTIHILLLSLFVVWPKELTNVSSEALKLLKHFNGKAPLLYTF